jgi:ribosomal protein L11 methyltransferase
VETFAVEEEDWSRSWKEGWRPTPLGERLLVIPAWWEESVETERSIVRIDPGTAFGTGTHATTRLAWELLEEAAVEAPPRCFLDVGTGSGILALGLLRLQDTARGLGTERDEAALASLRVNLGLNPGSERFLPVRCGALPFREGGFDLAVANLTELELRAVEAALAPLLAPGGRIVLSGLLAAQGEDAGRRWEARGYRREAARTEEGWTAIRLVGETTRSRSSRGNNR